MRISKILLLLTFVMGIAGHAFAEGEPIDDAAKRFTISGTIKDKSNGESLLGATIFVRELKTGTTTNLYGFYSLSLLPGRYTLIYSYLGYSSVEENIQLSKNIVKNIEMETLTQSLGEVVITDRRSDENIRSNEMSVVKMDIKTIKKIPALMGEVDVIKAIQLLPGVQTGGEGTTGFSVRGGSADQNLVLLDEATVYNASHLMGFFSVFNNDAVKEVKLYKGDIPSAYGGRLSSLLDVRQKEGNMKRFSSQGGIGTISSRLLLEGPVIKDKMSFLVAGRRSYADIFLPFAKNRELRDNKLYFYDLNTKLNYIINDNNRVFVSGYFGRDVVQIGESNPFSMNWGNSTVSARWNHLFSEKVFHNLTLLRSNYDYYLGQEDTIAGFRWTSNMQEYSLRSDFTWYLTPSNSLRFGASATYHTFKPGKIDSGESKSIFNEVSVPQSQALSYAAYASNEQKIGALLTLTYGLRYSIFQNIGSATVFNFDDNFRFVDSTVYKKGEIYNTYTHLEPRFGFNLILNEVTSIKGSYSNTVQYLNLASNATASNPLDIWLPSSPNIKPQVADQFALGLFRNFNKNTIETSVEVYYKKMYNQVDFRDHAVLLLNPQIEGELRFGEGYAYGAEFLVRKQSGKLTGWLGYTFARSMRKVPQINDGKYYHSPYDKTHDVVVVGSYQANEQLNFSATWVFTTGAPITFPTGRFVYGGVVVPIYSERNSYRMPDYHRLDLGVTYDVKKKPGKRYQSSWNLSVYNAYNRHNAFSITFRQNEKQPTITESWKTYLFSVVPALTYNFNF